jgi:outer membrane biogenesis lipoprotein LolB
MKEVILATLKRGEKEMKKLLSAFAVGAALLILTGCCCDKKCPPQNHTAQNCNTGECDEEKKENCKTSQTTADNDTGNDDHHQKGHNQPQSQKLSAR